MNALTVTNLSKTYKNGTAALKGISLEVKQGDFFALLGQNGAGKSTTISIISSLVNKSGGQVKVFDYDIDTHLAEAKSLIGVVPQEMNFALFEKVSSVLIQQAGYYGIPRSVAIPRMEKYLKEMGLWHTRSRPVVSLSGGMKRRLLIARALMCEPKLLILDEPTAGVDIELRHNLWKSIRRLNEEGTTIILTTHYLEEAEQLCKNVAIIDHGEIIENTSMKSLINRLQTQTFILDLTNPIAEAPNLEQYECRKVDESTIEVEIDKDQSINQLFDLLSKKDISVCSMRNKTNRLEELFIKLITDNKNVGDK